MPNYWDDELSVLSTENVHFAVGTAGLGSRFMAVLIDLFLQLLLLLGFVLAVAYYVDVLVSLVNADWLQSLVPGFIVIVAFLIFYGYFFFFEWLWHGLTPGKRMVGLRVLQANGLPATFWQVMLRNVLRIVDFMPVFYGVGAVVAILNDDNKRLGDQVAGTIVARERREEAANRIVSISAAADAFLADNKNIRDSPATSTLPQKAHQEMESVTLRVQVADEDYEIARDFILRRNTLAASARTRLAHLLAKRIAHSMNQPEPPSPQSESYLEYVVKNYER